MSVIRAHFDGRVFVPEEPVDCPKGTPVCITVEDNGREDVLARIARLARPGGLPADFSEQHDHYVKGTVRR
jgi:predicted DNA-binding antitoxin AbrB/MazE fold protein